VRLTRLRLTNFRVFRDLDLELPPGVVGIYGPNGSGKSTLVEAVAWALFGVTRTARDGLRSDGAVGECRASVEFEHDGHRYEITRGLSGAASTRAEAACDGLRLAAGAVAVRQYVHSVLGMSADAFRASVFCEQKQLDAFSGRRPEERRRLILDLLGITPLDRARDAARARGRTALDQVEAARLVLGDLDALAAEAATLEGGLGAAIAQRVAAEEAMAEAEAAEAAAEQEAAAAERRKAERDRLAATYAEAARRRDEAGRRLAALEEERTALAEAAGRLPALAAEAARLGSARRRLAGLEALETARARLAAAEAALATFGERDPELAGFEEEAAAAARVAGTAAGRLAGLETSLAGARQRRAAAAEEVEAAAHLDPDAPCPLCGQELGTCFEAVRANRATALEEAEAGVAAAEAELVAARAEQAAADRRAAEAETRLRQARTAAERRAAAQAELDGARRQVAEVEAVLEVPSAGEQAADLRGRVTALEAARDEALRLGERLSRARAVEAAAAEERSALAAAEAEAERLVEEGRALRFEPAEHACALERRHRAKQGLEIARADLLEARLSERGLAERLAERQARLQAELARRQELTAMEDSARHLGRLAELLGEFRNSLVGQVGPALSAQTTALFRELTDGRFDRLEVDAETFELRVGTGGVDHTLDWHSGSETDLANLSLRVAIGEQVNLLSGGQVGLLVLDEVLGSLDGEHRDRLLGALTRLGTRFRQILVVTHAVEVKEQLPQAIEVVPLGRGHSCARLAGPRLHLAEAG
jgi:exonuclease SbcC